MTCIVGLERNNKVYLAGDSASSTDTFIHKTRLKKVFKIETIHLGKFTKDIPDELILGYTSSFRMGQLLQYSLALPEKKPEDDLEYLSTAFIDEVRNVLEEGGYSEISKNKEKGGSFLIGFNRRLYYVGSDFQVNSYQEKYGAVGSGADIAFGVLYAMENSIHEYDVETTLYKALSAASEFTPTVCPPFYHVEI